MGIDYSDLETLFNRSDNIIEIMPKVEVAAEAIIYPPQTRIILLDFPHVISLQLITSWLEVHDFAMLDSAWTSKVHRNNFLKSIKAKQDDFPLCGGKQQRAQLREVDAHKTAVRPQCTYTT